MKKIVLTAFGIFVFTILFSMGIVWIEDHFDVYFNAVTAYFTLGVAAVCAYLLTKGIEKLMEVKVFERVAKEHKKTYITKELG